MECAKKKWFSSCKFEPRYDTTPPDISGLEFEGYGLSRVVESLTKKTYACDVCVKCGKTVKRPQ